MDIPPQVAQAFRRPAPRLDRPGKHLETLVAGDPIFNSAGVQIGVVARTDNLTRTIRLDCAANEIVFVLEHFEPGRTGVRLSDPARAANPKLPAMIFFNKNRPRT